MRRNVSLRNPTSAKVVPIIKCTCTVFVDNFINISTNSSIYLSVCRRSYVGYVRHKRNNPTLRPLRFPREWIKKMQFLFLLLLAWAFWSEMKISQGMDLAYLQTGIRGVFFWVLNFENLIFWGVLVTAAVFLGLLDKCCIFKCFIFLTVIFGSSFIHPVLQ